MEVQPHLGNIKAQAFGLDFFKRFDFVLNALDNIDARKHVNRVCYFTGTPLVDSGTNGYEGTVISVLKDRTPCYECTHRPPPKTFPICTIRAIPEKMLHCVVWAK